MTEPAMRLWKVSEAGEQLRLRVQTTGAGLLISTRRLAAFFGSFANDGCVFTVADRLQAVRATVNETRCVTTAFARRSDRS